AGDVPPLEFDPLPRTLLVSVKAKSRKTMNQQSARNRRLRLAILGGLFLTVAFTVTTSGTDSAPFLVATSTVTKPGEEVVGTGIAYGNSGVYFSAFWRPG